MSAGCLSAALTQYQRGSRCWICSEEEMCTQLGLLWRWRIAGTGDLHTAGFAVQGESPLSRLPDICSSDKLQSTNQGREQNCPAFTGQCFRLSLEFVAASCLLLCIFFVNSSTGSRLTTLLTMLIQQHWICPQKKEAMYNFCSTSFCLIECFLKCVCHPCLARPLQSLVTRSSVCHPWTGFSLHFFLKLLF